MMFQVNCSSGIVDLRSQRTHLAEYPDVWPTGLRLADLRPKEILERIRVRFTSHHELRHDTRRVQWNELPARLTGGNVESIRQQHLIQSLHMVTGSYNNTGLAAFNCRSYEL